MGISGGQTQGSVARRGPKPLVSLGEREHFDHCQPIHTRRSGNQQWHPFKGKLRTKSIKDFSSEMTTGHEEGTGEDLRRSGGFYACQNLHHTSCPRPPGLDPHCVWLRALDVGESAESSFASGWRGLLPVQTHRLRKPQPGWLCSAIMCLKSNKTKCFSVSPLRDHV